MAKKGISLHIGVNKLDPDGYKYWKKNSDQLHGWDGKLGGCEFDAQAYAEIAKSQGYEVVTPLLTEKATVANVTAAIKEAAETLVAGDIFFITFAGHGGQIPDTDGDEALNSDNPFVVDAMDETWCLHDRHFIDDEKHVLYLDFKPGVRIVEVNDSCHSGGMDRGLDDEPIEAAPYRGQPGGLVHPCYHARKPEYVEIQNKHKARATEKCQAHFIHLAACQADELAGDGVPHGKFTEALKATWKRWSDESIDAGYDKFYEDIKTKIGDLYKADEAAHSRGEREHAPFLQTPNLEESGATEANFRASRPFSI